MPRLNKVIKLEVTPEQFLKACDHTELLEIKYLLPSALAKAAFLQEKLNEKNKNNDND